MKTTIVIPAYNHYDKVLPHGVESWKKYSSKLGIGFEMPVENIPNKPGCNQWQTGVWAKWDALRPIIDKYDKFLLVDSDTMVRWDLPNIFELTKDFEFCCIQDASTNAGEWHYPQWQDLMDISLIDRKVYFNAGVTLFTREIGHILLDNLDPFFEFYSKRDENGVRIDAVEQTVVNIIAQTKFKDKMTFLDHRFNNMVMMKYDDYSFINDSYLWHFTGQRMGGFDNKPKVMSECWDLIKDRY